MQYGECRQILLEHILASIEGLPSFCTGFEEFFLQLTCRHLQLVLHALPAQDTPACTPFNSMRNTTT